MASQPSHNSQAALDLINQLQDPQWALEAARVEDEANCEIGAGPDLGSRLGQFMADPSGFHQFQRLRALVLSELQQLLTGGNLGVGTEAAWRVGKERLMLRLKKPSPHVLAQLKLALAKGWDTPEAHANLQLAIHSALTAEDWEAIAAAAAHAIHQQVKQYLSSSISA